MDYRNGKIYVVRNRCSDKVYVGSTTQPLHKRMASHRHPTCDTRTYHMELSVKMRELGVDNFYIELVEEYPCNNLLELRARENYYIIKFDSINNGYNNRAEEPKRSQAQQLRQKKWNHSSGQCICGYKYTKPNRSAHMQSNRHKNALAS